MNKNGFSNAILISIVAVIFLSGLGFYWLLNDDLQPKSDIVSNEDLKKAFNNKIKELGRLTDSVSDFRVTNVSKIYARAEANIDGLKKDVYLVLAGDEWKVLDITEEPISCERAERIGFPKSMISDCLYEFPKAEEVKTVLIKLESGLITADQLEIVGQIYFGDNPSGDTIKIVSEDGEAIVINISEGENQNLDNLSDGDYVVVEVSISEDLGGEPSFNLETIDELETIEDLSDQNNSADSDLNSNTLESNEPNNFDNLNNSNDQTPDNSNYDDQTNQNPPSDTNDESNDLTNLEPPTPDYDITNLSNNSSQNSYTGLIDRDNSGLDVKIISDF